MTPQQMDTGTIDRLENQRDALTRHLADLENQIIETGQNLTAITETILRLRKKQNKTNKMAAKTEYYS